MKRLLLAAIAVVAIGVAVPVAAVAAPGNGNGATVLTMANPPANPIIVGGYTFNFFNGNGQPALFEPTYYHEVVTPSGVNNEVLKGTIANDTGHAVIYTADSGAPVQPGQTCWDFATGHTSPDWQMTISASGNYTLNCHFGG
jgi:hypothetical protein